MSRRTIAVVAGGLHQPSSTRLLADRLAEATAVSLRERGIDTDVQVVELREHAHDLTNMLLTGFASADVKRAIDTVVQADGVIAVTPIFSGSYSGLFKNFFDVLEPGSLAAMPVLIGATAGTARHTLALEHAVRPLFSYLHAVVVPTSVFGATEDFGATSSAQVPDDVPPLAARVERAAGELADLVAARSSHRAVDPFANPTSFADLLAGR
ncbi:MAG: FMN reductase [Cellulomonas sp.]|uniref:FMN reductase n=1 Tax=Cellulomonas sp. TaxID=40001 RepID=UPI0018472DE2|nr:FMN reductase [Cellulomonas sp.]NMM31645.1 FMN reductase [Cellulomonas sp.]